MTEKVHTPWTAEQVDNLNAFQRDGRMHEFTCGTRDNHAGDRVLIATREGWHCPTCGYKQNWAWDFMTKPLPPRSTLA